MATPAIENEDAAERRIVFLAFPPQRGSVSSVTVENSNWKTGRQAENVAEASRLQALKEQRRDAAATFCRHISFAGRRASKAFGTATSPLYTAIRSGQLH
jgi:hypothetical protein